MYECLHDGDTVSANSVISKEANDELDNHLGSMKSIVKPNKELAIIFDNLTKLVVYNITRDPKV